MNAYHNHPAARNVRYMIFPEINLKTTLLFTFLSILLPAVERIATPLENDQVKVLDVTVQPHEKTRLHQHKVNRVMVYLDAGTQHFEYEGGKPADLHWKAGQAVW